jgi:hypothetical protein
LQNLLDFPKVNMTSDGGIQMMGLKDFESLKISKKKKS